MRVGIDTGGTFTDLVLLDPAGRATRLKVPSTPDDPARALVDGLRLIAGEAHLESVAHGTTVATNAMLEERFHTLGLVTTQGFRHVLEIARQSVPSGYGNSYFWVKPDRLVPLERVFEVPERLDFQGRTLAPLDEGEARRVAARLRELDVRTVGVCFLHSYANPAHERRMREILLEEAPGLVISISSEVWPEYREYERATTTLVDAFVKPHVNGYLARAEAGVSEVAPGAPLLIMKSNGGVMPASAVTRRPIATALSGPAAGALGASWLAQQAGFERVITIDTGGTSTDVCLVEGAAPQLAREGRIGRFPVRVPMIDIVSVGTGGGSIAWAGPGGGLRVGPRSAGADPGPMAYGRGGDQPTLTWLWAGCRRRWRAAPSTFGATWPRPGWRGSAASSASRPNARRPASWSCRPTTRPTRSTSSQCGAASTPPATRWSRSAEQARCRPAGSPSSWA